MKKVYMKTFDCQMNQADVIVFNICGVARRGGFRPLPILWKVGQASRLSLLSYTGPLTEGLHQSLGYKTPEAIYQWTDFAGLTSES